MKNKKSLIALGVIVVLAIVGIGIYKNRQQTADDNVVRIGAILPLTGKYADTGKSVMAGIELAKIKLAEQFGKILIDVSYYDTKSEVKNAVIGYNKLASLNGTHIFFTTLSDNSLALKKCAIQDGNLLFCIASHTDITKDNHKLVFRPINTGDDEAKFLVKYLKNVVCPKKVFFYIFNTEAGVAVEKIFREELSDRIIGINMYSDDYSALRNVTTASTFNDADCVVVVGYSPTMGIIVKYLREAGYSNEIVANLGFNNPSTIKAAGGYANGIWYNDYAYPYNSSEYQDKKKFALENYHSEFTALSYIAYSCIGILSEIVPALGQDPVVIGEELSKEGQFDIEGVVFTTHEDGSITSEYQMLQIHEVD